MCGILEALPRQNEARFLHALHKIAHRGPDGYGVWHDENAAVSLGHRRLAILDLSEKGKQPMHYGPYVITFNGEIYNFPEIRAELVRKGHVFESDGDTEVIMASFQEYGPACLSKFNGMWAMGIWNKETRELFLARDRFGVKPLFYTFIGDQFIFASEMKAILPFLPSVAPSADFAWCLGHTMDYEATDKCLVEGIKRFPAAHYALVDIKARKLRMTKYWDTRQSLIAVANTYEEQVEEFRALFWDACKIRMRSDVTIGTTLSGGVDSSSVICAMATIQGNDPRVSKNWQHAFVATFPGTNVDETRYSKQVVDQLGIQASYLDIQPERGLDQLENYLYLFEEIYQTSPIPMMDNYKNVRAHQVVVTLDGHGADELFCGYGGTTLLALQDCGFNLEEIRNVLATYKGLVNANPVLQQQGKTSLSNQLRFLWKKYQERKDFVSTYLQSLIKKRIVELPREGVFGKFNEQLYSDFHATYLPTLLRNYDRYSMAHGVEARMPFMDYRLVRYCFSLNWQSKLRNGYTKSILRDAMSPFVPQEVIWRKSKLGFSTPFNVWMKGAWKEYLLDTLESTSFKTCPLLDANQVSVLVKKVIDDEKATYQDGENAWSGLMPYLWEKSFLKQVI